ncbi:MAG: response regulator [Inquilinus sp.]|nr:response regulator [Inquilinus sp.]
MRILHVENDPSAAQAAALMLQGVATVDWAPRGMAALDLAQANAYDLLLLDLMLPDIDGFELVRRLRAAGVETPFLVLSGLVERESEFAAMALGGGDFLGKPFTKAELLSRARAVTGNAGFAMPVDADRAAMRLAGATRQSDERRGIRRFDTVQTATIEFGAGLSCRIDNMSHGGAALTLADPTAKPPRSFHLTLAGGQTRLCRTAWRDGAKLGVKFLDEE